MTTKREVVARRVDLRLLVPVLVAWPAVAFVALLAPVGWVWLGAVASAGGAWATLRLSRRRRRLLGLTLAVLALLLTAAAGHRSLQSVGPLDDLAHDRAVVSMTGLVAAEPRAISGGSPSVGSGDGARFVVRIDVIDVTGRGRVTAGHGSVLVIGAGAWGELHWHDTIVTTVRLEPPDPGDDVVAVAKPTGEPVVVSGPGLLFVAADSVRADFREATAGLWSDARGLVPALVIGDTSRTPPDLTEAMLATGMSHLSAVSGSNVTLVLAAGLGLCRLVGVPRRGRPAVALAVLVGFVILARPEPSVIRAAVMGAIGLLALSTSRRQAGVPALAGAVVVLMAWDPWLSRSYGFALSTVATLGLLLFAQPWGHAIARCLPSRLAQLGPVLAVPIAAQAVCAPIVIPLQGTVSLIAVVANLLAAPLVAPTTIVGVAVALVSIVWVDAASVLAWGAAVPAQGIAWVARSCETAPFGSIAWGDSAVAAVTLGVVTGLAILAAPWAWHRSRLRPLVAVAVVLLTSAFVIPTHTVGWPQPGWLLVACDVGQGDGLVINSGPGHAVVVDAGPDPQLMDGCLDRLGIEVVDLVVLTHFHADHVEGLSGVLDGRRVVEIRTSPIHDPAIEVADVDRLAAAQHVPVAELRAGDSFTVGPVTADVWWPAREIDAGSVPNNGSIVMTVHVRGVSLLLAGDMEREAAAEVARAALREPEVWGQIDVLKVAHHGSSNRDDRVLDDISGRLALISVGVGNDYGHPAPALLHALTSRGFEVHRTDLEGDLAVISDERGLRVVGRG